MKSSPSENQAILHLASGDRVITSRDAEAMRAALAHYFSAMPPEELKNQWPGYIAQSPHGIGAVRITPEMVWIGRWCLQPSGNELHLAYSINPPADSKSWVEFFVVIRQAAEKWEVLGGPGTEEFRSEEK